MGHGESTSNCDGHLNHTPPSENVNLREPGSPALSDAAEPGTPVS